MSILAYEEGIHHFPLFVDYGQLAAKKEWEACQSLFTKLRLPKPVKMNLQGFGRLIPSGLTNKSKAINEDAFLPGRNILLLLVGSSYAYQTKSNGVAIGLLAEDYALFPDQTSRFVEKTEEFLSEFMNYNTKILAPLSKLHKQDVLNIAKSKEITGTYSCHSGQAEPCGACISCLEVQSVNEL
jgi:7-cyano-7-deazaguanine synthase